jgi:hypothetical protein
MLQARRHDQHGDVAAAGAAERVDRRLSFSRLECHSLGRVNLMTPPV